MVVFPNAKINLGLHILSKRQDGFHNLESVMAPIGWKDILEIIPSKRFSFQQTGLGIDGRAEDNLVVKAYHAVKELFDIPPVQIHLHKVIPMGAGLGGGSSDAAFAIRVLKELFQLDMSVAEMESAAARLGSDCPFFIQSKPALATGTGTELHTLDHELRSLFCVVAVPNLHVSTKEAYQGIVPQSRSHSLEAEYQNDPADWTFTNDFEASIFPGHPEIADLKNQLIASGAVYASMSGSGSSVFGLFRKAVDLDLSDQQWSGWIHL